MRPNRRPKKRETWTIYEGDSTTVAKEFLYNAQNPGGTPSETKNYAYDPSGNLIALSDSQGSTTNRYTTVENPQSSVSLLLNQSGGPVQSYGYSAYGQANSTLTQNGSLSASLNPYRFQSKRLDTTFNTYDMGARRYSLTTSRWQQEDVYYEADQNLGLSQGGTTANRYEFGSGNPVNYLEAAGHSEGTPITIDFRTVWFLGFDCKPASCNGPVVTGNTFGILRRVKAIFYINKKKREITDEGRDAIVDIEQVHMGKAETINPYDYNWGTTPRGFRYPRMRATYSSYVLWKFDIGVEAKVVPVTTEATAWEIALVYFWNGAWRVEERQMWHHVYGVHREVDHNWYTMKSSKEKTP